MNVDVIVQYVVSILPSLIAVCSIIATAVNMLKQFKDLREEVKNSTEMAEIKNQLQVILNENYTLKKQLRQVIESNTKVKQKEE